MNIPIARTDLNQEEIRSVLDTLNSGWLVQGPKVKAFEDAWSNFNGSKHSIAVTSCTSALYLSLAALGFRPGDEAIVPSFTWISTANVIEHLGGKVRFCDIDLSTFNIDETQIETLISDKTKAILPVHLFGFPADMGKILSIAKKYNLLVIEDAACGFGSTLNQKNVGNYGNTGCFSFHPRKAITTGEGGMITTNDDSLANKIRCLRDHGSSISDLQRHHGPKPYLLADHIEAGYNLRMTDIQASIGASQMKRASEILKKRKLVAKDYDDNFRNIKKLETPLARKEYGHSYQSYVCLFEPNEVNFAIKNKDIDLLEKVKDKRNLLMDLLLKNGISTRPGTHAVHSLKFYKEKYNLNNKDFINSQAAASCSIALPLFHGITKEEKLYVINTLKNLIS